jgi:signal transduction histidine kinase
MRERASLLGGTASVQSGRGQGTMVEAKIPYEPKESELE